MWVFKSIDIEFSLAGSKYLTFVGAGGKTSLIEYIARRLSARGKRVLITTTTKIFAKKPYILFDDNTDFTQLQPLLRVGSTLKDGKLTSMDFKDIEKLGSAYDTVLIEADGAKGKPLKFPSSYEPVIPPFSDRIFILGGLDAIYGRVEEKVFRWELFRDATGIGPYHPVTDEVFIRCFSADGLLKDVDIEKTTVVLNKYDFLKTKREGITIGKGIVEKAGVKEVVVASVNFGFFYSITNF